MHESVPWWKSGILYQIYPRSFQDSNGDGIGDLRGIIQRLPYLRELGVNALWLSPIYPSPMEDFGYDISDYTGIDPLFGTLDDFGALVVASHNIGLKVILDLVPNHTSDRHPWFIESRSSRHNPKRDWYIWRDGRGEGAPPNNWLSEFGGSSWEFDAHTEQYYYHAFLRTQPDLNWRNTDVRRAMYDVMRFWLRRGVDGFRVDVMWHLIKDDLFRDNPRNPDFKPDQQPYERLIPLYSTDRPEVHAVVAEMRRVIDEFDNRVMIGEIYLPPDKLAAYYGHGLTGAHIPFNFALISTPWNSQAIANLIDDYEKALPPGAWPNWVLGNHDRRRIASRVGPAQARVAAMLLLTLRGTPTLYYGDEIGMTEAEIPRDRVKDPFEKNLPGIGVGRDGCRTPMQWEAAPQAGFSTAEPWLPLHANFAWNNVAAERLDTTSILNLYLALIELRRERPELISGDYRFVNITGDVLMFERIFKDRKLIIVLNLGAESITLTNIAGIRGGILLSTYMDRRGEKIDRALHLRGAEGLIMDPVCA